MWWRVASSNPALALGEPAEHRPELLLARDQPREQRLLGRDLIAEGAQPLGQRDQAGVHRRLVLLRARDRALQVLEVLRGLLEHRLDVGRDADVAGARAVVAAGQPGQAGEPLLHLVVEAVLRLVRLEIEEAQDQGAREAEQRRAERGAHAGHGCCEPALEIVEHHHEVALADRQAVDHLADRADGLEQAPEGAEQAEEDQQPDLVARDVARFVEARADAVEQVAHRHRRQHHPAAALLLAERAGDRRQQAWCGLQREARLAGAERLDPAHLRLDAEGAAEHVDDADQQHREDQAVEQRVVEIDPPDDVVGEGDRERRQHQEDDHAVDETLRTGHRPAFPPRLRTGAAAASRARPPAAARAAGAAPGAGCRSRRPSLQACVNTRL